MEKLDDLQPEPQIVAGGGADLGLLRYVGRTRAALAPAVVKINEASDSCNEPHIMWQISKSALIGHVIHRLLTTAGSLSALRLLRSCLWFRLRLSDRTT